MRTFRRLATALWFGGSLAGQTFLQFSRQLYLKMLHDAGVKHVFAGHLHYNAEARDGDLELVASGPVAMPLGKGRSGMRVVTVTPSGVSHKYYELGEVPESLK